MKSLLFSPSVFSETDPYTCQLCIVDLACAQVCIESGIQRYVEFGKSVLACFRELVESGNNRGYDHEDTCDWLYLNLDPDGYIERAMFTAYTDIENFASKVYDKVTTSDFGFLNLVLFEDSAKVALRLATNTAHRSFVDGVQCRGTESYYSIRLNFCPWEEVRLASSDVAARELCTLLAGEEAGYTMLTDRIQNFIPLASTLRRGANGEVEMLGSTMPVEFDKEDWLVHRVSTYYEHGNCEHVPEVLLKKYQERRSKYPRTI